MKIIIQKSVPEEIQIEVPGYFKSEAGSFKKYSKIISDESCFRFTVYEGGSFFVMLSDSASDVRTAVSEGTPITEAEFLKAVQECYTRFFLAAETQTDEVTAFEHILT